MPELPEVETIAQALRYGTKDAPAIIGRTITGVELFWERTLARPAPTEWFARLPGQAFVDTSRRGKFLLLQLTRDYLILHLRMSGDIFVEPETRPMRPHDRLVLHLDQQLRFSFNDQRKFGRAWLAADPFEVTGGLGPEPLEPDLTPEIFYQMLHQRRRQLKPLLLDQAFLAGMGNIYADESLHLARLHPLRLSDTLSLEDAARLLEAIRTVLAMGIKEGGASIDWVYRGGGYQDHFRAYGRTSQPCPVCGTPIVHMLVGQRSTHICPVCQWLER